MPDLPSPFNVAQLRRQAKELRALAFAGDRVARERIRQAHPRFGRSRLSDTDLAAFTLRDAQLCLARELGFEGWPDVLAHAHNAGHAERPWRRWPDFAGLGIYKRAELVSREAGHRHVGPEHALGALLRPETNSVAAEVLRELGITWERWHSHNRVEGLEERGRQFNPAWYGLVGFAEGLALTDGADRVADEHVLLALAYRRTSRHPDCLLELGADPDEVVLALARRGIAVSDLRPPASAPDPVPQGPRVFFPEDEFSPVTRALAERFPPGAGYWGWNTDGDGRFWIDGDADLNLDEVVRSVVGDPESVHVQARRRHSKRTTGGGTGDGRGRLTRPQRRHSERLPRHSRSASNGRSGRPRSDGRYWRPTWHRLGVVRPDLPSQQREVRLQAHRESLQLVRSRDLEREMGPAKVSAAAGRAERPQSRA